MPRGIILSVIHMKIEHNEIQKIIKNYAHDYRDMNLNEQELALMLSVFADEFKDVLYKLWKK